MLCPNRVSVLHLQIMTATLGLYLHIPWCATRCIYCDFNTYVEDDTGLKTRYQAALRHEIEQAGAALEHPSLDTIFIGGGTPTGLPPAWLVELVETVKNAFALRPDAEITVEANPGTLTLDGLHELRQGGINRLSLGVQSFNDDELRFLSRLHNADTARRAVEQTRTAGFDNLSLDLIFNLPRQSLAQWQTNLQTALELAPDHFSLYALIVEPGTPLYSQVNAGQIPVPDDDLAADMYAWAIDVLGAAGYAQYEISNWARTGSEATWQTPRLASAHNLIYWRNQPYLGFGAGAYSTLNGERWMNVKRPHDYIRRVESGVWADPLAAARDENTYERLDRPTSMAEHMLLGLRLVREGVSASAFAARFNTSLRGQYAKAIAYGLERDLLEWVEAPDGSRLRLTRPGRFLANQVMVQFMP